jgi:hypothetical protein
MEPVQCTGSLQARNAIGEGLRVTTRTFWCELTLVRITKKTFLFFNLNSISFFSPNSVPLGSRSLQRILCFLYHGYPLALSCHRLAWSSTEENGIAGTLPVELNRLQSLRFLLLEEGVLTGTIPLQLGDIRALEEIDLNFNLLQGPIPESLYSLTNLRQFDINDNELSGTISTRIGQLAKLSFFQIEQNKFSGTIPTEFGKLSMLGE